MKHICTLLITLSILHSIRSDFENCEMIDGLTSLSEAGGKPTLQIDETRTLSLTLNSESNIITKATFSQDEKTEYDGFLCMESSSSSDLSQKTGIIPCKQYLYYAHHSLKTTDSENLKCYREFNGQLKKTVAILILNLRGDKSAEEYLKDLDSYSEVNRYFIAVLEYIAQTADSFLPIVDPTSDHRWTNQNNLIIEYTGPNQIAIRFRFINTRKSQASRRDLANYIEQAFYYIKVFLYKNTSCKAIVQEEYQYDKALEALMQLDPTFPKNFRRIFAAIERTCKDSPVIITPAKLKHKILMKMVVMGYCLESIRYDMDTLHGLIDLVGAIFMEDQFFDRADDQARFENYFFPGELTNIYQENMTYKEMMANDETGKYIEKEVPNEPAFKSVIDKEIKAEKHSGSRARKLWLDNDRKHEDYQLMSEMINLEYESDEYDNVSE